MEITKLLSTHSVSYSNSYAVLSKNAAIVVDCGKYTDEIAAFLNDNKGKQRLILLTHAHYDHIAGAQKLREKTGVKIAVGKDEAAGLGDPEYNLCGWFNENISDFSADIILDDEEEYAVGDLKVKTYFTPGHTKGSVSYLIENALFSGDTLFFESVGRTDLPGGNGQDIIDSIMRLMYLLPDSTVVYPGHGESTSIGHEREHNPFLR